MKKKTRSRANYCAVFSLSLLAFCAGSVRPRATVAQSPSPQDLKPSDARRSELNSDGSMQGATLGRTGVFSTRPLVQPQSLAWASERLFATKDVEHLVSQSGSIRFAFDLPTGQSYSAPIFSHGTIYFTVYLGDGYLFALDAANGKERWRFKTKGAALSPPAVAGDLIFVAARDGYLYGVDAATGQPRWSTRRKGHTFMVSSPLVAAGVLYYCSTEETGVDVGTGDGNLYAVDAQTGQEKWVFKAKGVLGAPALDKETVYFGSRRGTLYAVDAATGEARWKFDAGDGIISPTVMRDSVFFGSEGGDLFCVDAQTGQKRWKAAKTGKVNTLLAAYNGAIYFGGRENNLHAVDAETGQEKWRFKMPAPPHTPVIAEGIIYAPLGNALCAVDAATGQLKWAYKSKAPLSMPPVVADGVLYYLDDNGNMFALN